MTKLHPTLPVVVIGGPTGVGKTALSIEIAHLFNGEVVNADSMQMYEHLDIGTGKITSEEMQGIPHHLLSVLPVDRPYSVDQFKQDATQAILDIADRGKLPIIVGGSGLYLEGLLYDLEFGFANSHDASLRQSLQAKADEIGNYALWCELKQLDPVAAEKIPYQNVRRTIRALEMIQLTGELFSNQMNHQSKPSVFNERLFILNRERSKLYDRINQRVHMMDEMGLEAEVSWLYEQANGQDWQSLKGIGYKEWIPYFEHQITKTEVIEQIQQNSRRYAKRQLTWFRNRMKAPYWIDLVKADATEYVISEIRQLRS